MSKYIRVNQDVLELTSAEFASVPNPKNGQLVYNTTNGYYYYYNGSNNRWSRISEGGTSSKVSLNLDGSNERVRIPANAIYEQTDVISVSMWIKGNTSSVKGIAGHYDTIGGSNRRWLILSNSSKARVWLSISGGSIQKDYSTGADILDGSWHHLVWTYKGSNATADQLKIYVDGSADTPTKTTDNACTQLHNAAGVDIMIGCIESVTPASHWPGQIAHMSIWDKELSSAEVTELYNSGVPSDLINFSDTSDLLGWWRLGEGDIYILRQLIQTELTMELWKTWKLLIFMEMDRDHEEL